MSTLLSSSARILIFHLTEAPRKRDRAGNTLFDFRAAMYLRFEPNRRRLFVNLVTSHMMVGRKVRQERLGSLGSIIWSDPFSISERARFWASADARYRALAARRPDAVLLDDKERIFDLIAERIPRPRTPAELRLLLIASVQREVAAVELGEGGEDAIEAAARRMSELARASRIEGGAPS
jgi:hypothetical protein